MENQITLKAFGMIAEKLGADQLRLENPGNSHELKNELFMKYPELKGLKFNLAINKKMVSEETDIPIGAEVALLPPFSGG
ncbi:molybdopterin synthase sulfur carrier subunit [Algoriphagus faecimaris]|uniref:Molybdopterin synthase sulfur carrier subunit n=1 Tax=Algoriphagus faecimaris TaxID=686796 RepID=A0A1G6UHM2_9BACT|nr:MoaD/ThiS family protein [Algoriphagus faecimaris]SDD40216.1 molybdopterin synthase sulfur carrier subunit [Algoriphagus faecimaris]